MKPQATTGPKLPSKHRFSRWEREWKRRRLLAVLVVIAILAAIGVLIAGYCVTKYKPWHQAIVKVNDQIFDMGYFVKMLRVDENVNPYASYYTSYPSYYASYMVQTIQRNELVRQKAEELGIVVSYEEIEAKFQSLFGFDPESTDDDDEFNQQLKDFLGERDISRSDLEEWVVIPTILQEKVQEAMGDEAYPEGSLYDHVRVKAVLVGTNEEALEVIGKWDGDFNQIVKDYSPTRYYPEGGYWLVMVYEPEDAEEQDEEGLYIKAILVATEEKAEEVAAEYDGNNFADLAEDYSLDSSSEDGGDMGWLSLDDIESQFGEDNLDAIQDLEVNTLSEPISNDYIEWLPADIESSAFDDYAFDNESGGSGVSDPIPDTTYTTTGGYWLVMVYEPEDAEEQEEEGLYIKAILLDSEETANELKDDISTGGDFATIAEDYSLDSSSEDGGDMGWLSLDDIESQFGEDNLATIQALELDTLSDPLEDEDVSKQSGYWVIEVLSREDKTLIEEHRDTYISVYYSDWLSAEIENGKEEGRIEDYILDDNDKISWAFAHI